MPLLSLTPKMIVLTADWVWNNPVYKLAIRNAEFLPASAGVDAIMPQLRSLVERGYTIAIYPEGTRSKDCSIGRFHQGAFYLAQTLDVDVLPLVLYGSGKALPKHGRMLAKWPMHMEIDPRISPERLRQEGTLRQQASYMRQYYKDRYAQLANRIEQNV
jgi:1-acyl-sn-glycerol-3-phosphate acyltransferase